MNSQQDRSGAILDLRTRALAERPAPGAIATEIARRALIVIAVGQSLLGLDIAQVAAVVPFEGCARMPMRDPAVLGVIGRAGRFYSVIGLRQLLASHSAGEDSGSGEPAHLLLLRGAAPHLALAVDRVLGRFDLAVSDHEDSGTTFDLDGQLVALFNPETLRGRFGRPATDAPA